MKTEKWNVPHKYDAGNNKVPPECRRILMVDHRFEDLRKCCVTVYKGSLFCRKCGEELLYHVRGRCVFGLTEYEVVLNILTKKHMNAFNRWVKELVP